MNFRRTGDVSMSKLKTIEAENSLTETDINFDDNNKEEHGNNNGVEDGVIGSFGASEIPGIDINK